jgi:hypothetical protein
MALRRLAAVVAAVVMVLAAVVIRDRVVDDGAAGDAAPPALDTLVCASELRDVCRDLAIEGLSVRVADAGATLADLGSTPDDLPLWLTFEPFPEMVDELRRVAGRDAVEHRDVPIASSPLAVVARADDAAELVERCGDPVDLACLGAATDLSPTFAPLDTGVGTLGVAAAVVAFGADRVDLQDLELLTWARRLRRAGASSLSGTAIQTIQVRPTFGVAVGAEAELAEARRAAFVVLYAGPMSWIDVVLTVPTGAEVPADLSDTLAGRLLADGWQPAEPDRQGGWPAAGTVLAIRDFWGQL